MHKSLYITSSLFVILIIAISACNKAPTFADLCDENPKICNEFKEDTWCKKERIAVGFANLSHQQKPDDAGKYKQLISYENYAQCMNHASKIEHIKFKEKQTMRVTNVVKAKQKIKEISQATENSNHPHLLYYHWSRYLNKNALQTFLDLESTNKLETPDLQFNLATYYAKRDQSKTLKLLYHALELTNENEAVNTEIFKSIATIFADKKKYTQVYIWSQILATYSPEDETIKNVNLQSYAQTFNLDQEFLDTVALKTLNTILEGKFKAP
ncbi:DUF2989 domain-containing protein [Pseudocolwellia agarivorans]|jgi:hypothetical protein|uniref:DUF2989 domain-containing protein n=1 Tax=Pseudocolwellia agarivorans TaxID=1911682 RepID=UPI003F881B7E